MEIDQECESHANSGEHNAPAVGHCRNPDYSGYWLCQECIDEYDSRMGYTPPESLTISKRITTTGTSLAVVIDRPVADELGVDYGDMVEITIRRVK